MKRYLLVCLLLSGLVGCSSTAPQAVVQQEKSNVADTTPLLLAKEPVLSEAAVQRLITSNFTLPAQPRLAIYSLSSVQGEAEQAVQKSFLGHLKRSSKFERIEYLPPLLISAKPSLTDLRGAAARYQTNLLLLYRAECLAENGHRCRVEALLMDLFSGSVPFSVKTSAELGVDGWSDSAQATVIAGALEEVAFELNGFLGSFRGKGKRSSFNSLLSGDTASF